MSFELRMMNEKAEGRKNHTRGGHASDVLGQKKGWKFVSLEIPGSSKLRMKKNLLSLKLSYYKLGAVL